MQIPTVPRATVARKEGVFQHQAVHHASSNGDLGSDEEDEQAELLRELEKIKRERAEQRDREVNQLASWLRPLTPYE